MGLRRYTSEDPHGGTFDGHPTEYYRAADVDALLARIRAAVAAERASMRETNGAVLPGAALDALLADGGA